MSLSETLKDCRENHLRSLERFVASLDPSWVEESLQAKGTRTVRNRKLPAEKVIWLVMGMVLLADRSIARVVEHMNITLKGLIAPSAISQARARLTSSPLQFLFGKTANSWSSAGEIKWRGLGLYGLDGSHMRVSDADCNDAHFGRPLGRTAGGYPQLRFVGLMNLTTRILSGAAVGPWRVGETTLARDLWPQIPDNSLTVVDRGFLNFFAFLSLLGHGDNRHFLSRGKSNTCICDQELLPDGTVQGIWKLSRQVRDVNAVEGKGILVRVIHYQHRGGKPSTLITTLLDYKAYPAADLIEVYHARWELETAFDEIKTHLLRREDALRSRTVEGVYQEFWSILLVYNLIRREICTVAELKKMPVTRMSFTAAMFLVSNFFLGAQTAGPGQLAKDLEGLEMRLGNSFFLPPRRSERRNPRQVKVKMSNYLKTPLKRRQPRHSA